MPYLDKLYLKPRLFRPSTFNAYLLAMTVVAAATAARVAVGDAVQGAQFLTLLPAVIATTLICGMRAGLFSVALGAICAWYFILPPASAIRLSGIVETCILLFFVVVGSTIVLVIGAMRSSILRARDLNDKLTLTNSTMTALFDANPDGILVTDQNGHITRTNKRADTLFGRPHQALTGTSLGALMPARFRDRHIALHSAFMAAPSSRAMGSKLELFALAGDGREFPVDIQIGPIRIDGQTLAIAVVRDLTEQKAVQAELAARRTHAAVLEEREAGRRALETALESTTDSVAVLDRNWRITYSNTRAKERFGRGGTLVGAVVWDAFPALAASALGAAFRSAMNTGEPAQGHDFFPRFQAHFDVRAYPSKDGLTIFLSDVTAERRAVAALAESEARLRLFIDRAPVAIAMFDVDMRYLAVSQRFATDYDLGDGQPEAFIGRHHYDLFPEIPERWRAIHRRVLAGETLSSEEDAFRRPNGNTDWVKWEMTPWHRADGTIGGALLFTEDVNGRKEAEQALRGLTDDLAARLRENEGLVKRLREEIVAREAAQARAAQAERVQSLGEIAGGMAHDFNNLLGVIILNLGVALRMFPEQDRARKPVADALASARSGAALIRGLLAFARRQPPHSSRIDINEQVSAMHGLLSRVLPDDIEVMSESAPDLWPVVADASQVEACLMNLATNARDAMPKGGRLTITTANQRLDTEYAKLNPAVTPGDYAMIAVSDTGSGMTPQVMAKIFDPFFTTKEQGKGTGLGLSMVFGFVNQAGGHVSVDSTPGIGTTIRLFLPRAPDAGVPDTSSGVHGPAAAATGRGETVLVTEDNSALREIVVRQLGLLNYQVLETDSAPAALKVLEARKIDLVFSDVVMPGGIDGFDLAEQVRARWPSVKVLLTSGFLGGRPKERTDEPRDPPRVLTKPYDPEQLAHAVREALDT